MEIRIYYESLEQAEYYIKPIVIQTLSKLNIDKYDIKLIEKVQQSYKKTTKALSQKYAKSISAILIQKNPDLIISIVKNNIEIPIIIMEFSTAVFVKDHELQRTDNFNIAKTSKAIYIKISSIDKKTVGHGGDSKYNYIQPYAMYYQNTKEIAFHINWDVEKTDSSILIKDTLYKSIPKSKDKISQLIYLIFNIFKKNTHNQNWKEGFTELVEQDTTFSSWVDQLKNFKDFENITKLKSTRTKWEDSFLNKKNVFILKFNRFGHAMDPERGMLSYYGTYYKNNTNTFISKIILDIDKEQWFKGTSQYDKIKSFIKKGFSNELDLVKVLCLGLNLPDCEYLIKTMKKNPDNIYDISAYLKKYLLLCNIAFRNIVINSDILHLTDDDNYNVYLTWDQKNLNIFSHDDCPDITEIIERKQLSEDDVTFITIHNFFKDNNIDIFSVSYPGAQSDTPVLPDKYSGRSQDRVYIDAIGLKNQYTIFQENKGPFNPAEINDDLSKMKKFRVDIHYKKAVNDFFEKYKIDTKELILGVGFGMKKRTKVEDIYTKTTIEDVDYFFIITEDMSSWKVYSSIDPDKEIFTKLTGKINRIKTYKVVANG